MDNKKNNLAREDISKAINDEFGFSKKECQLIVSDIIEIIISGLQNNGIVKIHGFGTFKTKRKNSRVGRNPKTKKEFMIDNRLVISFKASKKLLKFLNLKNEEIS